MIAQSFKNLWQSTDGRISSTVKIETQNLFDWVKKRKFLLRMFLDVKKSWK